jgi:predicted transcriptional regulator
MIGAIVLVAALGFTVVKGATTAAVSLRDVPISRHAGQRRDVAKNDEMSDDLGYSMFLVPLASLMRRRTELAPDGPFSAVPERDHRRDELGIIVDVLAIAQTGASKKAIRHGAGLNLDQTNRYTSFLMNRGLLALTESQDRKFLTTAKGRELLMLLRNTS